MNYTVFFTNQCNMDCSYCYERNKKVRSTSYDVLDDIVNFIVDQQRSNVDKMVSVVTHGGEPLIEFDKIQYFIKRLDEKAQNVQYIITTNATLLTDLMIDFLSQHYSEISVSIDGIQLAHDANRVFVNKKGSYNVVVGKAKKLLEKRSDVKARMTITSKTASTLYESVKHLLDLGFTTIVPVIDAFYNDWTEKDMEVLLNQGKLIIDYLKDYDKITNVGLINDSLSKMANSPCNGGTSTFSIDTDGAIYPCVVTVGMTEFVVGTIKEGVNKEKVAEILSWDKIEIPECIGCSRYNYCNTTRCRMINKVMCGSLHTPSAIVCSIENLKVKLSEYYLQSGMVNL
ncbi:MAG: 4Fe-4S cluster-binding domain-containing protein [Clostridia bacterium]|nr:4Fe-4S cluster-binding domain-containing protein [Clostridia bacterium]MBO6269505.1 4Fe-4S cluster-binding domain-containing protein [Clostridium sp.]